MSKELKIVLIAGGTLVGLIVLIGIAGILTLPKMLGKLVSSGTDPRNVASVNAKIADFKVPPGYVEISALNMFVSSIAVIEPADQPRSRFQIQLQAIQMPAGAISPEQNEQQLIAGTKLGLTGRCSSFDDSGTEEISVRGKPVEFKILECNASSGVRLRYAVGNFAANAPYVTVLAIGTDKTFDDKALRALLGSIK